MTPFPGECWHLAESLAQSARAELELTPKPGLVDRLDNGSHPDLSFELMSHSIDLLPQYFEELLEAAGLQPCSTGTQAPGLKPCPTGESEPCPTGVSGGSGGAGQPCPDLDLDACIAAGQRAEARMVAAIGTNAHRGYIFLSGLVLLASAAGARSRAELRGTVAHLAARILARQRPGSAATNGARLRRLRQAGGIHAEALAGLPSVFEHGLRALEHGVASLATREAARHHLMATLMTKVEDTTALHRCGQAGLDRLRRDGRRLQELIEGGWDYRSFLVVLNDEYRAMGLTMGGVADCMALTMALHR